MLEAFEGKLIPRAFAERVIEQIRREGDESRANRYEEDRDTMYRELRVTEAAEFMRDMSPEDFAALYESSTKLDNWKVAIEIEQGRRYEAEAEAATTPAAKAEAYAKADNIFEQVGEMLTSWGQGIQQATLLGMSSRGVIKMMNSHLKKDGALPLTAEQEAVIRDNVGKVNKAKVSEKAGEAGWKADRTEKSAGRWLDEIQNLNEAMDVQNRYLYRFVPRNWGDILVTQVQGNLLTPASLVLNMGANVLIRPIRATTRGLAEGIIDPASDLMYAALIGKGKAPGGKHWKEVKFKNPAKGAWRTLRGFGKGLGVQDTAAAMAAYAMDMPGSYMWRSDWKGAENAIQVLAKGGTKSPYELDTVNMAPANSFLAAKQLRNLIRGDAIRHPSMWKQMNEFAKAAFETTLGFPPDVFFRLLHAGDVPFRKAAEYRIIGELAEKELAGRDLTGKERRRLIQTAIDNPRTMFSEAKVSWIEELAAAEVYQQRNFATEVTGKAMGKLRKDYPYLGHLPARLILPYQKTPINVTAEILSYTTVGGIANVGIHLNKLERLNRLQGNESFLDKHTGDKIKGWTEESRRDLTSAISKLVVGQAIGGAASEMASYGLIQPTLAKGQGEPYKVKRLLESTFAPGHINLTGCKRWAPFYAKAMKLVATNASAEDIKAMKDQAFKAAQWREGDVTADLVRTGSAGAIMLVNVDSNFMYGKAKDEDRDKVEEAIGNVQKQLSAVSNFMMSQPYTQTVSELVNFFLGDESTDVASFTSKMAETATTMVIPRSFSWWDMIKEGKRPTYSGGRIMEQIGNKVQARLDSVGLDWVEAGEHRKDLPVMLNHRGEERLRTPEGTLYVLGQPVGPKMWHIFGMGKFKKTSAEGDIPMSSPVESELMRLMSSRKDSRGGPDSSVIGSSVRPFLQETRNGKQFFYNLNPRQFEEYQRLVGQYRYKGHKDDPMLGLDDWVGGSRARRGGPRYWELGGGPGAKGDELRAEAITHRLKHFTDLAKSHYLEKNRSLLKRTPRSRGVTYD